MFNKFFEGRKPEVAKLPDIEDSQEPLAAEDEPLKVIDNGEQNLSQTTEAESKKESFARKTMENVEALLKMAKSKKARKAAEVLVVLTAMAASSACMGDFARNASAELKAITGYYLADANTKKKLSNEEWELYVLAEKKKSEIRAYMAILDHEKYGTKLPINIGSSKSDKLFGEYNEPFFRIIRMYKERRNSEMIRAYILSGISNALREYMEKKGYVLP